MTTKHYYHYYCESLGKNLIINHLTTCFRVDSLPPSYGAPILEHDFKLKLQNVIALGYLGIPGGEF